jgi:DNA-binding XRE family transcriptional regulator
MTEQETWKNVVGYEGIYKISSLGRVRSFYHNKNDGCLLKLRRGRAGYLRVWLCLDGKKKPESVHRLVAKAFLGPAPSPCHEVNHKNGDKTDNRVENLEWVTSSQNKEHARDVLGIEYVVPPPSPGEQNSSAKLTRDKVKRIRRLYATDKYTQRELGQIFGVAKPTIGHIVRGESWKHVDGPLSTDPDAPDYTRRVCKLTTNDVRKIRELYATGDYTQTRLGHMFDVAHTTIGLIVNGKTWNQIP